MTIQSVPTPCPSDTRKGIALMLLAMALVPMIDVFAKQLALQGIAALQIIFMRMTWGTLFLAPVVLAAGWRQGWPRPGRGEVATAFLLGLTSLGAGVFFFAALRWLSIADTLAISFVQPLFVTLMSRFILKERVDALRWLALILGFCGTLVIIRPSSAAFEPASLLALASGMCMAAYAIVVRSGAGRRSSLAVTFQTHAIAALLALPMMLAVWQSPTSGQWASSIALALVGLAGQYLIIRAYDHCEASLIAPLSYTEIITSTLASWWFFRQVPDGWTFAGVAVLVACALMIARRA